MTVIDCLLNALFYFYNSVSKKHTHTYVHKMNKCLLFPYAFFLVNTFFISLVLADKPFL